MQRPGKRTGCARRFSVVPAFRTFAAPVGAFLISWSVTGCARQDAPAPAAPEEHAGPVFHPLFDGVSLTGWTQRGGKAEYRVQDGVLVGATRPNQPNSFLCTRRDYADFILELDFKVDPALNSGVQIRSESRTEYRNGVVHGYQVEIDPSPRAWTGGIYDESRRGWLKDLDANPAAKTAFRRNDWNRFRIEAIGPRLRTWLNGVPAADLSDAMTLSGFIALQVHGVGDRKDELLVQWKNIRIAEITPPRDAAPAPE